MEIDRSEIVDLLRVRGQHDKAEQAERELTGEALDCPKP